MADSKFVFQLDGQELQQSDVAIVATEAAHADDYMLAEFLRLAPFVSATYSRAIIPFGVNGQNGATVQSFGASGSVLIKPFRAVVGSRVGPGAASTDPVDTTGAMLNWRDIRSCVYSVSDDSATLGHAVAFSANSSGNPRWDLVYATLSVDQNGSTVQRFVQPPNSPTPTTTTGVVNQVIQTVTISVVTGTTAANPTPPSIPSDTPGSGIFNIPLANVMIPNGFTGASLINTWQIFEIAPVVPMSAVMGAPRIRPPTSLSSGLPNLNYGLWASGAFRTGSALPTTMTGGEELFFGIDGRTSSPVISDGSIFDKSVDWRNRIFRVDVQGLSGSNTFAWQQGSATGSVPMAGLTSGAAGHSNTAWGQSFEDDSAAVLGTTRGPVVCYFTNATLSDIASGANSVGLYVNQSDGTLRMYYQGTPGTMLVFWIRATGAMANY